MPDPKHDASTDIEKLVISFPKDMTEEAEKIQETRLGSTEKEDKQQAGRAGKEAAKVPTVTFSLSPNTKSIFRTPAQQAAELARGPGATMVCWGAHMSDKARHVLIKIDGGTNYKDDEKAAAKAFGEEFGTFKTKWGLVMRKYGLKNKAGGDGWAPGDPFHLELPGAKISRTSERANACLDEYARLTRVEGEKPNKPFEEKFAKLLAPHIKKYEKK